MTMPRKPRALRRLDLAAWTMLGSALAAAAIAGSMLDGYSHAKHPLALLGADGMPRAAAVNAAMFVLPGALGAMIAARLRGRLPQRAPLAARLGVWMLALSALAYALQGLAPLQVRDLARAASRLHAAAWTLWWVAFVPAAVLLAWGLSRVAGAARVAPLLALAALVMVLFAALPPLLVPAATGQRVAWVAWLLCFVALSRSAVSAPGWSTPVRT